MSVRKGNKIIAGSYAVVKPEVYTKVETDDLLNQKQDKLIAGNNIFIDENNVISSSGGSGSFINVVQETGGSVEDVMSQASVTYELEQKANTIDLADVSLSGDYEDLSNTPDLSVYTKTEDLAEIAFTADYEDLGNTPDLTLYVKNEELSKVATTNNYNDLDNKPNLELYDTTISVNNKLSLKQDLLKAGEGISIEGNIISSTVNSAEWGNIIGDITNQADLQEGLNNKLGTTQVTNCLLEVPHRVKLELNDGVLTLKAGSQVIVPNGFEADGVTPKFDYVTIENDTLFSEPLSVEGDRFMLYDVNNKILHRCPTVGSSVAYDIATNSISYGGSQLSLPFAITTHNDLGVKSIDQTFNGMGYIGSTVWVDKGVKGLIPNGRNEDGTLKNVEWTNDTILTRTFNFNNSIGDLIFDLVGTDFNTHLRVFTSDTWLDSDSNSWVTTVNATLNTGLYLTLGGITFTNSTITSFTPKQPFGVPDIQDVVKKTGGTITGYLNFVNNNITDSAVTPSTSQYTGITFYDAKGQRYGKLEGQWSANGYTAFGFNASRTINGSIKYSNVSTWIDSDGGTNFSFPKCTTKATTTSSASSNRVAVVVQNYVNGTSWYRVWSDGWCEQGGVVSIGNNADYTVTLLKKMANTDYTVTIGQMNGTVDAFYRNQGAIVSKSTTSLVLTNRRFNAETAYSLTINWVVQGYIA